MFDKMDRFIDLLLDGWEVNPFITFLYGLTGICTVICMFSTIISWMMDNTLMIIYNSIFMFWNAFICIRLKKRLESEVKDD